MVAKLRTPYDTQLLQAEKVIIESALIATESIPYAAAALGVDEGFIRQRIDFLGIEVVEEIEEVDETPAALPLEQNDNLVGAFDEGWSCTDCGAEGEASTPQFHNKGCPTQPVTLPSTPRPVAVAPRPVPVAVAQPVAPPAPAVISRPISPSPVLPTSIDQPAPPPAKQKRAKKEATPEQRAKWAETMAKARAAKIAKETARANNVVQFVPATPVVATVAPQQNMLPPGPYADPPPAPTFGPLHPENEPGYVPDADEVDDEGELSFCTCAETGPNKCNIHKFGGDGKIRT
jgi:hypothetical protein